MIPLLLVEDDRLLVEGLGQVLASEGFAVEVVGDGVGLPAHVARVRPGLVLLDIGLPHRDGFAALTDLRSAGSGVPVLILTARGAQADVVRGLDLGADGYLAKPFSLPELLARIRALLRRSAGPAPALAKFAGLTFATVERQLTGSAGCAELTMAESGILATLLRTPGIPVARRQLIEQVLDDAAVTDRAIDFHIANLRKKLAAASGEPEPRRLRTVHGRGWVLLADA